VQCYRKFCDERAVAYQRDKIGELYRGATIRDLGDEKLEVLQSFLNERWQTKANFFITGKLGCGKTRVAAGIIRFYATVLGLKTQWNIYLQGINFRDEILPATAEWQKFVSSPLVIIDEIFTLDVRVGENILAFIDERYRQKRLTIGIANHSSKQVMKGESSYGMEIGPKIMSRLTREDPNSEIVITKAKDGTK